MAAGHFVAWYEGDELIGSGVRLIRFKLNAEPRRMRREQGDLTLLLQVKLMPCSQIEGDL